MVIALKTSTATAIIYTNCCSALFIMEVNIGDKLASDDYCAIGVLTKKDDKLMVVGDFGEVEYENYFADWKHYHIWEARVDIERKERGGLLRRIWNAL